MRNLGQSEYQKGNFFLSKFECFRQKIVESSVKKSKFCYRLVWAIVATFSHALSFTSFVPILFTVFSDGHPKRRDLSMILSRNWFLGPMEQDQPRPISASWGVELCI